MARQFYVYVLASRRNGTLYTSVTSNLAHRVWMHREGGGSAFTTRYGVRTLVRYELFSSALEAISAERRIKRWRRAWKLELIERLNAAWEDLYETLTH